jgi:3-methyladenine DNA glycosylase/8-oxoguanine DNA glycosylase
MPYWTFHEFNVERRRADSIRAVATEAGRLATLAEAEPHERLERLQQIAGVGPWTAAEAARLSFGDPDAVSVGDFHIPRLVCRALAGEPNGDDARMLELLEPYRGQRARVVLLLERGGLFAQRRAPRMAPRSIAAM